MTPLVDHLRSHGDGVAVLTDDTSLTYRELADRAADIAAMLGPTRRLVMVETRNDLTTLVHYLGALAGDHVVLPISPGRSHSAVLQAYDPDVVIDGDGFHERRHGTAHRLHPDLALLLSTSGSTGSPKLVRLSRRNLVANAESIAEYLDIRETDRAATTLPMSYCYGLSVIHSHLLRGAGLILTDRSVVDDEFWDGVPRAPRHLVRRRALHVRAARPDRLRRHGPTRPALRHPGRRQAAARTRAQLRGPRANARAGNCS